MSIMSTLAHVPGLVLLPAILLVVVAADVAPVPAVLADVADRHSSVSLASLIFLRLAFFFASFFFSYLLIVKNLTRRLPALIFNCKQKDSSNGSTSPHFFHLPSRPY
jgi:hypothetical protein